MPKNDYVICERPLNYDSIRFPSSACPCGNGIQDAYHILLDKIK